jgi:hypothetical protein
MMPHISDYRSELMSNDSSGRVRALMGGNIALATCFFPTKTVSNTDVAVMLYVCFVVWCCVVLAYLYFVIISNCTISISPQIDPPSPRRWHIRHFSFTTLKSLGRTPKSLGDAIHGTFQRATEANLCPTHHLGRRAERCSFFLNIVSQRRKVKSDESRNPSIRPWSVHGPSIPRRKSMDGLTTVLVGVTRLRLQYTLYFRNPSIRPYLFLQKYICTDIGTSSHYGSLCNQGLAIRPWTYGRIFRNMHSIDPSAA